MRLVFRQHRCQRTQHAIHFGLGFAHAQTADGNAFEADVFQAAQRFFAQIFIHRALDNAKQRVGIAQIFKRFFAAFCPAQAHLQRFARFGVAGVAFGAFV